MKTMKLALHWQMGIALILGIISGWAMGCYFNVWGDFVNGIGRLFLHSINMIVIPLVFLSTLLSVSKMNSSKAMGRVAVKSFLYFVVTAIVAAFVGILITDALRPGYGTNDVYIDAEQILADAEKNSSSTLMDWLVNIVPSNVFEAFASGNILSVIFFSLTLGWFITKIRKERQNTINGFFESLNDVIMEMTSFIIRLAPIGVFAIVMALVGGLTNNVEVLKNNFVRFAFFIFVVWISLIVMGGMILPMIVGLVAHVSPLKHLKQVYSALMVAFSTSSSYSALPLIITDAKEKFGVSNHIAGFTIPLGITFNKIGTIIYECVAVIFVAQAVEIELSATQQISLMGISIVTVLGAPAVPMAGVVTLAILLKAMNLPDSFIGMFMAVDILCDMPKTLLNAYSVSCSAIIVAKSEGEKLKI